MATIIKMKHKDTGITKNGFYGFSWTTFLFGFFPALFRSDFITFIGFFVVSIIIGMFTMGIGSILIGIIWSFMYNKYYTQKLVEGGYQFAGSNSENALAAAALGIDIPANNDAGEVEYS